MNKLFLVGDSTVSSFNDDTYYYSRYGYGTQLFKYLNNLEIINLALSGRSSKSFKKDKNFEIYRNDISSGDYVIIGFGHNDEKYDDMLRFTNALLPSNDENSFKFHLKEYIDIARNVSATPILCTPITRYHSNNEYSLECHKNEYGDYRMAIIELGKELNIEVIDLTLYTVNLYKEFKDYARYFHAIPLGKLDGDRIVCDFDSMDKTHTNILGASLVAYYIASTSNELKQYFNHHDSPTKKNDLFVNPLYKYNEYKVPNLDNEKYKYKDWYYTIFGDITSKDYFSFENKNDYIIMSQANGLGGKINLSSEGYSFLFKRLSIEDNFIIEVNMEILESIPLKDQAFGLMVRDDCYMNQETKKELHLSNYISSGMLGQGTSNHVIFSRDGFSSLEKGNYIYNDNYKAHDIIYAKIERIGQRISCDFSINDNKYHNDYYDFDLTKVDNKNIYVGLFLNRGTVLKVNNINLTITGKSLGA